MDGKRLAWAVYHIVGAIYASVGASDTLPSFDQFASTVPGMEED